jgi:hypothetical protein
VSPADGVQKSRTAERLPDFGRNQKNAVADDGPDHDRTGVREPKFARKFRAGGSVLCVLVQGVAERLSEGF